jgi:hypothetical protein
VQTLTIGPTGIANLNIVLAGIAGQRDSVVITASILEPTIDMRNSEVFERTLLSRDDQLVS